MTIEEAILAKVRALPPDKQHELLDFAELLRTRSETPSEPKRHRKSLLGLWAEYDIDISEADITELRREMWGNFPREDIA